MRLRSRARSKLEHRPVSALGRCTKTRAGLSEAVGVCTTRLLDSTPEHCRRGKEIPDSGRKRRCRESSKRPALVCPPELKTPASGSCLRPGAHDALADAGNYLSSGTLNHAARRACSTPRLRNHPRKRTGSPPSRPEVEIGSNRSSCCASCCQGSPEPVHPNYLLTGSLEAGRGHVLWASPATTAPRGRLCCPQRHQTN